MVPGMIYRTTHNSHTGGFGSHGGRLTSHRRSTPALVKLTLTAAALTPAVPDRGRLTLNVNTRSTDPDRGRLAPWVNPRSTDPSYPPVVYHSRTPDAVSLNGTPHYSTCRIASF